MINNITQLALGLILLLLTDAALAETTVKSLRGDLALSAPSKTPEIKHLQNDKGPIKREFFQQPPLIPHAVTGYVINKQSNKCLTCHSWANAAESGATKISLTHFADRDGVDMANVSARRYFCDQCHVPQMDAEPLVGNTFQPIEILRPRE